MHPGIHAAADPERIAYIVVPNGETVTYRQLEDRSNQCAQLFRSLGLKRGDVIAILLENHSRYHEIAWAADRAGLYYTCISTRLSVEEAAFILRDSASHCMNLANNACLFAVAARCFHCRSARAFRR